MSEIFRKNPYLHSVGRIYIVVFRWIIAKDYTTFCIATLCKKGFILENSVSLIRGHGCLTPLNCDIDKYLRCGQSTLSVWIAVL